MDAVNTLRINMLGGFSLLYGSRVLVNRGSRSKKVWAVLAYLISFRHRDISQTELIEMLWPNDEISDPANTLKTLMHRVRALLAELNYTNGKEIILSRGGSYAWNSDLPAFIDAEVFDSKCEAASAETDENVRLELLMSALSLFDGDYLPSFDMEVWAAPLMAYYHSLYIKTVHTACELLGAKGRFQDVVDICQRAVAIDPYDESLHHTLIEALMSTGNNHAAMTHYNSVNELFVSHFGINPSPELTALYKRIIKTSNTTEMNLHVIREDLKERESQLGAFFCEYEIFKDIYRLKARADSRTGQAVHIALITLLPAKNQSLTTKKTDSTMDRLKDVIASSLRKGDVFTRFSVTQYLVMLPSATIEDSDLVLQRISRRFRQTYTHISVILHYSILPMDYDFT